MKNILFVVNPKAGNGIEDGFIDRLKKHCENEGVDYEIYVTTGKNDTRQIETLLNENNFEVIFSAGGDGTFTLIAELVKDRSIKVGIIPIGTSNGLASDLGIDSDPFAAFQNLLNSNHILHLDQIVINDKETIYHIGDIGANANLIKRYESSDESSYAAYAKHVFEELRAEQAFAYEIETPEGNFSGSARMIAICNARRFGTKVALSQKSHPADGLFELIVFREIDIKTIIESGLSSIWDGFDKLMNNEKQVIQTHSATVRVSPKTLYQLDGEVQGDTGELKIQIHKGVIDLLCQGNCPYLENGSF